MRASSRRRARAPTARRFFALFSSLAVAATCGLLALGSRFVPFSIDFDSPTLHEWSICSALISEVLMVASLLTYHRGSSNTHGRGHRRQPSTTTVEISNTGTTVIAALCCALAFAGAALLLAAKNSREAPAARLGFTVLALACFAIAVPVTHGVGGRLRWALGGGDAWSGAGRRRGAAPACGEKWLKGQRGGDPRGDTAVGRGISRAAAQRPAAVRPPRAAL